MSRLSIMPAATIILPLPPVVAGAAAQGSPLIRKGCRLSRLNPAALCTKTAMAITANRLMAIFIFINKPILSYWGVTYAIYLIRTTPPRLN